MARPMISDHHPHPATLNDATPPCDPTKYAVFGPMIALRPKMFADRRADQQHAPAE